MQSLVNEAQHIQPTDNLKQIAEILIALSKYLDIPNSSSAVQSLLDARIFPVVVGNGRSNFDMLCSATEGETWFIADRAHLKESFEGLVPLLAFNPTTIEQIRPLIDAMNISHHVLSNSARGVSKTEGKVESSHEYTSSLHQKSIYISRSVTLLL